MSLGISLTPSDEISTLLRDISPSDRPWDIHKQQSLIIAKKYKDSGRDRYSERILDCAKYLEFSFSEAKNKEELRLKLFNSQFCRVRHCPICQWRVSMKWIARLYEALPKLLEDYPTAAFLFLTLTVPNCDLNDLKDTIKHLNKSWQRLSQRKAFPAIGYLKSLEITRAKDDKCHPHIHAVLMVRRSYFSKGYLSQAKWTELWQKSLKADYTPIVHIKRIKPKPYPEDDQVGQLLEALRESVKYSTKPEDLMRASPDWVAELTSQLHKTRSVSLGGAFRDYMSETEPEDLIGQSEHPTGEDPTGDIVFGFKERLGVYSMIDK